MDSIEIFHKNIREYYYCIMGSNYSNSIIDALSDRITNYVYNLYSKFYKEKPKSRKRYATLKISDLDHPLIHDEIILFAKKTYQNYKEYVDFCSKVLEMSNDQFIQYEKKRRQFYDMF